MSLIAKVMYNRCDQSTLPPSRSILLLLITNMIAVHGCMLLRLNLSQSYSVFWELIIEVLCKTIVSDDFGHFFVYFVNFIQSGYSCYAVLMRPNKGETAFKNCSSITPNMYSLYNFRLWSSILSRASQTRIGMTLS